MPKQSNDRQAARPKRVNLKVPLSDELYQQIKDYKARHKVSISSLVRDFMLREIEKFEVTEKRQ